MYEINTDILNFMTLGFTVDMGPVDIVLKKQVHMDVHKLSEFCNPVDISKVENLNTYTPNLCAFKLSQPVLDMATMLHAYNRSNIFVKLWNDQSQEDGDQCATLEDVVQGVWLPVKNR